MVFAVYSAGAETLAASPLVQMGASSAVLALAPQKTADHLIYSGSAPGFRSHCRRTSHRRGP